MPMWHLLTRLITKGFRFYKWGRFFWGIRLNKWGRFFGEIRFGQATVLIAWLLIGLRLLF
jgi:hypothetical protein